MFRCKLYALCFTIGIVHAQTGASSINTKRPEANSVSLSQQALNNEDYSIRAFGAKGDCATDDTTAINRAFTGMKPQGGKVYFPFYNNASGNCFILSSGLTFSGNFHTWQDRTLYGDSEFASMLTLANGVNQDVMSCCALGSGATTGRTRFTMHDIGINGNASGQSSGNCYITGVNNAQDDLAMYERVAFYNCYDNGFYLSASGNIVFNSSAFLLHDYIVSNGLHGININYPGNEMKIMSSLIAGNGQVTRAHGLNISFQQGGFYGNSQVYFNLHSVMDHWETNTSGYAMVLHDGSNVTSFLDLYVGNGNYVGPRALNFASWRNMLVKGNQGARYYSNEQGTEPIVDLFYSADPGSQAIREAIAPTVEQYYDLSSVKDWDGADVIGDWTASANASIGHTSFASPYNGQRYIFVQCTDASPCYAYQDVVDTFSTNSHLEITYGGGVNALNLTGFSSAIDRMTLESSTGLTYCDSGYKIPGVHQSYRNDYVYECDAKLTAGNWRVKLWCNGGTTNGCLYNNIQFVKNYVKDPSVEAGAVFGSNGWTLASGTCPVATDIVLSGAQSISFTPGTNCNFLWSAFASDLVVGRLYKVSAWMYVVDTTSTFARPVFCLGTCTGGTTYGHFTTPRYVTGALLNATWQKFSFYWYKDDTVLSPSWGNFLSPNQADVRIDNVSIVEVHNQKQLLFSSVPNWDVANQVSYKTNVCPTVLNSTVTGNFTIDASTGCNFRLNLTGNATLTAINNGVTDQEIEIWIIAGTAAPTFTVSSALLAGKTAWTCTAGQNQTQSFKLAAASSTWVAKGPGTPCF